MSKYEMHKENINAWKKKQDEEFIASLPFSEQIFQDLFDYLDLHLESQPCEHDFKLTDKFLKSRGIDLLKHTDFFIENGGGCDCEVLMNMEDLFPNEELPNVVENPKPREKINELELDDLKLDNIPSPWNLFRSDNYYEFQFGKNSEIKIKLIKSLNNSDWKNEEYWKNEWEKMTALTLKSDCEIIYDNCNQLDLVTVKTKDWIPVLTWIKPTENKSWGLLFITELSRFRGDLNELKNLLKKIK